MSRAAAFGFDAQGTSSPPPGSPYPGAAPPQVAPLPPSYPVQPTLPPSWNPQPPGVRLPALPRGIDIGLVVIGVGALLTLLGFLCGAAATGQLGSGGTLSAYQAWLGSFFVLSGFGIFLTVGGWLFRTVMAGRQSRF